MSARWDLLFKTLRIIPEYTELYEKLGKKKLFLHYIISYYRKNY